MITVTAFKWVPPFAQGVVRDLRVRWALEEAGLPYEAQLLAQGEQAGPDNRAKQPFGQVPAYEGDGVRMFESGAIVLHIAEQTDVLMPKDAQGRARAMTWVFASLNSIETIVQSIAEIDLFHAGEAWTKERRPQLVARATQRLGELEAALGAKDYLEGRFTAGDLMMTTVLRITRDTDLLEGFPKLQAYQARCEARPAFRRALAAQMAAFG